MIGRPVLLEGVPRRIISLVPSQTELLYDLGLAGNIVGQTVFCVHPKAYFKDATKVGGTKKVKYELIESLKPDLIVCNKEENTEEIVTTLVGICPVWVSDIKNLEDACHMILLLGHVVDRDEEAGRIAQQIRESFAHQAPLHRRSCIYLIWKDPYMAAGTDTFINDMLRLAGFDNMMPEASRYPDITIEYMRELNPEVILLSSEPYPFRQKHIDELQDLLPQTRIILADGEFFSWYGSRLVNSQLYFKKLQALLD
jgi:ABC-type Fe3+-hydroxamate transport system substrate-binding protein